MKITNRKRENDNSSPTYDDYAVLSLRILDLILVSHVYSHIGKFDQLVEGGIFPAQRIQISQHGVGVTRLQDENNYSSVFLSQRKLKCLDGFLGGSHVWVFHGLGIKSQSPAELHVSATPDAFADVWGPMWKVNNVEKPREILRYDLEHGSLIPFGPDDYLPYDNIQSDEGLWHWITHKVLRKIPESQFPSIPEPSRLLIGAFEHTIRRNDKCPYIMKKAHRKFVQEGWTEDVFFKPSGLRFDSSTVGTAVGGAAVGAPTINYSHTLKNIDGFTAGEAFSKRWNHRAYPNWNSLLMYYGLEISVCTYNSRRLRVIDLLAGTTVRAVLNNAKGYAQKPWKNLLEYTLDTNREAFIEFATKDEEWARDIAEWIGSCLEIFIETGFRKGSDVGKDDDTFCALWSYGGQEMNAAFPSWHYSWTELFNFGKVCTFVVLEKCLENRLGRNCCHVTETSGIIERGRNPAVLEMFLDIGRDRPAGMDKLICKYGTFWKIDHISNEEEWHTKGKRSVLKNHRPCEGSQTEVIGEWSSRKRFLNMKRQISVSEHLFDYKESEPNYLPYLIEDPADQTRVLR